MLGSLLECGNQARLINCIGMTTPAWPAIDMAGVATYLGRYHWKTVDYGLENHRACCFLVSRMNEQICGRHELRYVFAVAKP